MAIQDVQHLLLDLPRWQQVGLRLFLSLAKEKKAELVTGDPEFKALEKELKIAWLTDSK